MGEDEIVERIARAILMGNAGGMFVADDEMWKAQVSSYKELCAKFPQYAHGRSDMTDAFRSAKMVYAVMQQCRA